MECVDCGGEINFEKVIKLMTGCHGCGGSFANAYPCERCGRLHWPPQGDEVHKTCSGVYNRAYQKAFLIDDEIVHK